MNAEILDIDEIVESQYGSNKAVRPNHILAPQHDNKVGSFRMLISGKSGSGKTNLVVSMILQGQITFDHIYLYTKSLEQLKYRLLLSFIKSLEVDYKSTHKKEISFCTTGTRIEDIIPIDQIPTGRINLCIFDDLITERHQEVIESYFVRGRHRGVDAIYISQAYHSVPILIRKNCDYFCVYQPSSKGEFDILKKEHRPVGDDADEFAKIFKQATSGKNSFLFIDKRTDIELLQYRKNLNHYWDKDTQKFEAIEM